MKRVVAAIGAVGALAALAGCGGSAKAATPTRLSGLFAITAGQCTTSNSKPTGSYLVVISAAQGKAVKNPHGGCANPAYTLLGPGTDGGIETGAFQGEPSPVFNAHRDSLAKRVIAPVKFGPFVLGFATTSRDEQDAPGGEPAYPAPEAQAVGGDLSMDLRSLVLTYAGNPSSSCKSSYGTGCWELGSRSATGTYNAATKQFALDWFTGESFTQKGDSIEIHLEGTLQPKAAS